MIIEIIENIPAWLRLVIGWAGVGLIGVGVYGFWLKRKEGKIKAVHFKILILVALYFVFFAIANTASFAIDAGLLPLVDYRIFIALLIGCSICDMNLTKRGLYLGAIEQNPVCSWMIKKLGYRVCQLLAILMFLLVGQFILSNPDNMFIGYTLLFVYLVILVSNIRVLFSLKKKRARALIVIKEDNQ